MKHLIYIVLMTAIVFAAKSQTEKIHGAGGHFRAGYANYSMASMNSWLDDMYPRIRKDFISFGGSGYVVRNNLIIGGEGFGLTGATVSKDTLSVMPTIGMGMLNVGYALYRKRFFLIYPLFGVGGGGLTYQFREVEGSAGRENHYKEADYKLKCSTFLLSVAVGADKYAIKANNKGVSIGLRFGYTFAIQDGNWKRKNTEVSGPNLNLSGFFATIAFGGGRLKNVE